MKKLNKKEKDRYLDLIDSKAFEIVASKVDKVSGDLRICFEILRNAV